MFCDKTIVIPWAFSSHVFLRTVGKKHMVWILDSAMVVRSERGGEMEKPRKYSSSLK